MLGSGGLSGDVFQIVFQAAPLGRGRLIRKADLGTVVQRGADRARHKAARAIGADVLQHTLNAVGTKGAFVTAYPRLCGVRRQVFVTHLAIGSEFQHGTVLSARGHAPNKRDGRGSARGMGQAMKKARQISLTGLYIL